mmetsp:Transcript_73142/g.195086  ORF Transcript_73142/g.195086 Transcript_73142/m.195086 type:complete len:121 (-) Transcript_73142:389-751(-)
MTGSSTSKCQVQAHDKFKHKQVHVLAAVERVSRASVGWGGCRALAMGPNGHAGRLADKTHWWMNTKKQKTKKADKCAGKKFAGWREYGPSHGIIDGQTDGGRGLTAPAAGARVQRGGLIC